MEQPTDLEGWWDTKWGMTADQLEAALVDSKLRRVDRIDYSTHYVNHIIEDAEIGPFKFEVSLQMLKATDRLDRVVMRHKTAVDASTNAQTQAAFNALVSQFGAPQKLERPESYRWDFPTTTVELNMFTISDMFKMVAISFMSKRRE